MIRYLFSPVNHYSTQSSVFQGLWRWCMERIYAACAHWSWTHIQYSRYHKVRSLGHKTLPNPPNVTSTAITVYSTKQKLALLWQTMGSEILFCGTQCRLCLLLPCISKIKSVVTGNFQFPGWRCLPVWWQHLMLWQLPLSLLIIFLHIQ